MAHARNLVRASLLLSALVFAGAPAASACPPSEGDFDFEFYDISGDGMVQLPEGVQIKAVAKTSTTDKDGKIVVDNRPALIVQDPTHSNARVMTMHLTPTGAGEVKEWLASAIESQEAWLKETKATEKAGLACTLDAKRCREMGKDKKATLPSMWVTVSSHSGRHGWSLFSDDSISVAKPSSCSGGAASAPKTDQAAKPVAAPEDTRIAIQTYDRSDRGRPLTMKMDTATAKVLLADLTKALDERDGKVQPAPGIEKKDDAGKTAS